MNSILVFLVVLVVLLLIGAPVATSFGLSSIVYILMQSVPLSIVAQRMISSVDSLTIMCVPLFILAGELMGAGGIAKRLVRVINLIFGNVTGGLALVTVVVCAFFAALTGSAMACSVAIGSIMLPYMLDAGYDRRFSAAIIASAALQVPPTYRLESYVINTGNTISASAQMKLTKNGQTLSGVSLGDGPVDAAFLAIESILGRHYELDDFQIQAVTEGREAMGESVVKLRSGGKLYSGRGISTDIIGASVHAYLNAINKIVYEEAANA